jgi:hypothetical protein
LNFCPQCGQENLDANVPITFLVRDLWDDLVKIDSRFFRTLIPLLFRPGFLTQEYSAGRRMRFVPPLKIYLICSFALFLIAPTVTNRLVKVNTVVSTTEDIVKDAETKVEPDPASNTINGIQVPDRNSFNTFVNQRMARLDGQNGQAIADKIWEKAPTAMFFLLPLFAALLYALNAFRPGFYYVQHLVFALHCQAFYFIVFSVMALTPPGWEPFDGLAFLTIPIYSVLALRRFYRQGWLLTLFKGSILFTGYVMLLSLITLGALIVAAGELPNVKKPSSAKPAPAVSKPLKTGAVK